MTAEKASAEISTHKSFCRFCHASCAIEVDVADGKVVKVRGDRGNPMFRGYTCIKGRELPAQHNHEDRLRSSLRRKGDGFEELPSEQALDEIAAKLRAIIDEHGPRAVAIYCGTGAYQCATGLNVAKAFMKGLGSPSFYSSVTIDQPAKVVISTQIGMWQGGVQSFESADVVMMIGNNPLISSFAPQGTIPGFSAADKLRTAKELGYSDKQIALAAHFAQFFNNGDCRRSMPRGTATGNHYTHALSKRSLTA